MEEHKDNNEHQKFLELCEYVRFQILEIPLECKFPKALALRLRGLHDGKFMANKKTKPLANYSFETILLTFKIYKYDLLEALRKSDNFKNESHKINYMMAIIESKINDVVLKIKREKKKVEIVENLDFYVGESAKYTPKTKKIKNDKLNDLW